MQCSRCKHKINIPTIKYRLLGIGISLFGIFGWFSFLFAGSGHAFLIACGIVIFGIFVMYNAEEFAKDSLQKKDVLYVDHLHLKKSIYIIMVIIALMSLMSLFIKITIN